MPLALADFVRRWKINSQSGRGIAQSRFLDLCDLLGEPRPRRAERPVVGRFQIGRDVILSEAKNLLLPVPRNADSSSPSLLGMTIFFQADHYRTAFKGGRYPASIRMKTATRTLQKS